MTKYVILLTKLLRSRIEPFLEKCFGELSDYTNAFKNCMMKREVIADKVFKKAKKSIC